jgi:hypothetical protein
METQVRKAPLTGKEGAVIEVATAADWTKNHRHRNPGGAVSHFFGQDILQRILGQPECIGLRFYYANSTPLNGWQRFIMSIANFLIKDVANSVGDVHLIISGVTEEGFDQIPTSITPEAQLGGSAHVEMLKVAAPAALGEQSVVCPGGAGCPSNILSGS